MQNNLGVRDFFVPALKNREGKTISSAIQGAVVAAALTFASPVESQPTPATPVVTSPSIANASEAEKRQMMEKQLTADYVNKALLDS